MDLKKLTLGDQIIGGSGIVLFLVSFLSWFKVDFGPFGDASWNAWDAGFLAWFPVLIGMVMVAIVAIRVFAPQVKLPDLPLPWGQALFIAGAVAAVLVLLKLLLGEDEPIERAFGLYIGTLAALGLAAGGYVKWKMEPQSTSTPPTTF